jgi:Lipopolysaccharide kinase (Kdo/WaaP) family
LKERGLCDKGFVPQYYGSVKEIQPKLWSPHLDTFLDDLLLPNAILIEYIPHMQMLDLLTFSAARLQQLVTIMNEIHQANILHGDPYPRNMMVVSGETERVLWIDFDRAQTYTAPLTERQQKGLDFEAELVAEFADGLVSNLSIRLHVAC